VNNDGIKDYLVDTDKDGIYDAYHDPNGEEGNYAPAYYDSKTGTYSSSPPAERTPIESLLGALTAYWYLAVLCAIIVLLAVIVVGKRRG